ncbi:uncharacterized protein LOC130366965 isoform X2 [Hyla sarda]|uniref:uncharacterized protein LOC130366965 isoform X2 n=1 Tax=Hyla sarda TaxID=327740 RepID=UPI0024C20EF8|nr:uncharacterized protein LOC130366965 isoform X2 [Hyla sarda]
MLKKKIRIPDDTSEDDSESGSNTSSSSSHKKVPEQELSAQESKEESVPQVSSPWTPRISLPKSPNHVPHLSPHPQEAESLVFVAEDVVTAALGLVGLMKGRAGPCDHG